MYVWMRTFVTLLTDFDTFQLNSTRGKGDCRAKHQCQNEMANRLADCLTGGLADRLSHRTAQQIDVPTALTGWLAVLNGIVNDWCRYKQAGSASKASRFRSFIYKNGWFVV